MSEGMVLFLAEIMMLGTVLVGLGRLQGAKTDRRFSWSVPSTSIVLQSTLLDSLSTVTHLYAVRLYWYLLQYRYFQSCPHPRRTIESHARSRRSMTKRVDLSIIPKSSADNELTDLHSKKMYLMIYMYSIYY